MNRTCVEGLFTFSYISLVLNLSKRLSCFGSKVAYCQLGQTITTIFWIFYCCLVEGSNWVKIAQEFHLDTI